MTDVQRLSAFRVTLNNAASVVFLSGAGESTESGIPDFQSKDGLYRTVHQDNRETHYCTGKGREAL